MRSNNTQYKKEKPTKYNVEAKTASELYLRSIFTEKYRDMNYDGEVMDPPSTYDKLIRRLPYEPDLGGYNEFVLAIYKSCHIGQFKLLLAEINATNMFLNRHTDPGIIIYAGSAPSMKLLFLMKMFPNVKFILIDPNEFFIYDDKYDLPHYVRQDPSYVKHGAKWGGIHTDYQNRIKHKDEYVYLSHTDSNMYTSNVYKSKYGLYYNPATNKLESFSKPTSYGARERRINQHVGEFNMMSPRAGKESIKFAFAADVKKNKVFFIEEYFTSDLARIIAEVQVDYPNVKTMFWSDIRTNLESENAPKDEDIMLNNAWTYVWLRILKPKLSMLKFRTPFFNDPETIDISVYKQFFDEAAQYGFDWNKSREWLKGKYSFFPGTIELQCWHGAYSKETRLIVKHEDVINNNMIEYDVQEYDEKFNYFNNIQRFAIYYTNPFANEDLGFDHCYDCSMTAKIFADYMKKNSLFNIENMFRNLERILVIRIKNRDRMFAHGHMFPKYDLSYMLDQINKSDYSILHKKYK